MSSYMFLIMTIKKYFQSLVKFLCHYAKKNYLNFLLLIKTIAEARSV